jgi:ubiquinone/menaquinone biosynthesis C-methylase UbiE
MDGSCPSKLRVWDGSLSVAPDLLAQGGYNWSGPHNPAEFAERLFACETLETGKARLGADEGAEPYTLQWFLTIENQRHGCQGRWIPRLLEFAKHQGETLLGLGNGLGTDWLQYARHGATVVVCSPSATQLALIRRNFELRGLPGRFLHASPHSLPLEGASIDVACISNLLQETEEPRAIVEEVYRVLKPGGKVLAVTPARYHVDFWSRAIFFWQRWLRRTQPSCSGDVQFSARRLRRLFHRFTEPRVYKRQLRRSEVPHVWRWLPLAFLERLMGRVLVFKAFKPLSAAITLQAAA